MGKSICDLLEYKDADRVGILISKTNPGLFLIQKNPIAITSYKISKTEKSKTRHFAFSINCNINFPMSQSLPIEFDINEKLDLILNLNKIII